MDKEQRTWGEWAFIVGIIIALVMAFFPDFVDSGTAGTILLILGVLVGAWNITTKETHGFLMASIALLLIGAGGLDKVPGVGTQLASFVSNLTAFVAPAVFIVALKAIFDIGRR